MEHIDQSSTRWQGGGYALEYVEDVARGSTTQERLTPCASVALKVLTGRGIVQDEIDCQDKGNFMNKR